MAEQFFEQPVLNSPYAYPARHWELDETGQPTNTIVEQRRLARFISPVPRPKTTKKGQQAQQMGLILESGFTDATDSTGQEYNPTEFINAVRQQVDAWRRLPDPAAWKVTPETARLLQHWRSDAFHGVRPFFCQVEAVETAIWLAEVAPHQGRQGHDFLDHIAQANAQANPELLRIALKLATGAGKTTVMAMLIAWQTINAVRHPTSSRFSRGFLVVVPNITIRDRLRVLQPNDPDSYYASRELVPHEFLGDIQRARIVITNYHAFKHRERSPMPAGSRALLQGHSAASLSTLETDGQMLQRVLPELLSFKRVLVLNDEAHHCYRERADRAREKLDSEEQENNEAARLWISGIEALKRTVTVSTVYDLSATPFFLRGSGYVEGTLFPWTVSDFSLLDAIECGIVKLPRVPVADNIPNSEMPKYRALWEHMGKLMPRKGRSKNDALDPNQLPQLAKSALEALYGHYAKTLELWQAAGIQVPPVFIVVCNNTASSKLVYDYISGFFRTNQSTEATTFVPAHLPLFSNFDEHGNPHPLPKTLLIDSQQLDAGDAISPDFRDAAAAEIALFRRQQVERTGNAQAAAELKDAELLREVLNTVGKAGMLGEQIRCVVSVSMLNEGWDAQTVTHVLGIRAFGTQLLCEQVVGRALRRQSYELNEQGLFNVEYADILGIPFDFTAKPVIVQPQPPSRTVRVCALRPERDALEQTFPRLTGYRLELPNDALSAHFSASSQLRLTPELVGPSITENAGLLGESVNLTLEHLSDVRESKLIFALTSHLLMTRFLDADGNPRFHLFNPLKKIVRQWLSAGYLTCVGGTYPAQLLYRELAEMACIRIMAAINAPDPADPAALRTVTALLDPYNPVGSTRYVNFTTSKTVRTTTRNGPPLSQVNYVVCDSSWEDEFCRVVEDHPAVRAYVKNQGLNFEVPYVDGATPRMYRPDFLVRLEGPHGTLNLVVEIKGFRGENAATKAHTMHELWIPAVNALGEFGHWAFAEFTDPFTMQQDFAAAVAHLLA